MPELVYAIWSIQLKILDGLFKSLTREQRREYLYREMGTSLKNRRK